MSFRWPIKDPDERLDYSIDWSRFLGTATFSSTVWSVKSIVYNTETGEIEPRYKRTFNPDTGEIDSDGLPENVEDRLFEPSVMGSSGDAFYCEGPNGYANPQHFIKVGCTHRLEDWSQVNNPKKKCGEK